MKSRFLPIFLALGSVAFAQPRPLEGNPGNVFISGQEVVVKTGGGKWICVDYDGKEVAAGTGAEAKLGKTGVGYYEVWQLADDGSRMARTTFAVLEPLKVPVPDDTPIAIDTAAAWFYKDGAAFGFKEAASLSALAGVGWVRDRLSWPETEPEKGKFAPETKYDRSVDAFSSQGLKVLQVFHSTPKWAGEDAKHFPDDLRDAYHYLKAMSARWKGKVRAWEPWNEGDTSNFGSHTGAEMMAYQKAAWHGIRAGDPDAVVGQNVFAEHRESGVIMNFIENLDASAFDTFNFHHYVRSGIPEAYATMRKASGGKPVWITESYFHFRQGVEKSDVELSDGERKLRARFLTTNLVTGLNEGPEQFFTFVLPHYLENGILFGVLNGDNTPRADYVALAAAGRLLAGAKPLGAAKDIAEGISAYGFSAWPDGQEKTVVVAWAAKDAPLPAFKKRAFTYIGDETEPLPETHFLDVDRCYDFIGREIPVPKTIGTQPVYLILPKGGQMAKLRTDRSLAEIRKTKETERKDCSPLVIQTVFPPDRLRLDNSSWFLRNTETMEVPLRVYHFGKGDAAVSISLETDEALAGALSGSTSTIGSLGRWDGTLSLKLSGAPIPARPMLVRITATAPGMDPCFSVVRINTSLGEVTPLARKDIAAAKEEGNWKPSSSKADLGFAVKDGTVEVTAKMKGGDRWVYPWLPLPAADRPDDSWDGIAFTIVPGTTPATYHVMLKEPNGATWSISVPDVPADGKPRRVVMLFDEFSWASYTPHDSNGKLDRSAIEAIAIGGNPKGDDFGYAVKGIEWVKFAK